MVLPGMLAGSVAEQWGLEVRHYGWPLVGGLLVLGCAVWAFQILRRRLKLAAAPRQ